MGEKLTPRQRSILEFIRRQISRDGRSPTVREICTHFNFKSTNGARDHIKALIKKGHLERDSMLSRGIRLVQEIGIDVGRLPLVGTAPAGAPITAIENFESEKGFDFDEIFKVNLIPDQVTYSYFPLLQNPSKHQSKVSYYDHGIPILKKDEIAHLDFRGPPSFV